MEGKIEQSKGDWNGGMEGVAILQKTFAEGHSDKES